MVTVLIRHKVADFNTWKAHFNSVFTFRKSQGECNFHVFCDDADPSMLTLVCEWENAELAKKFFASEDLKKEMKRSGVVGEPEIHVVHEMVAMRRTAAD